MLKFAKIIHKNKENFLIKKFIALFKRKIKEKIGRFSLVLTGGKSPRNYRYLSLEQGIPWSKIDFFISDERCVNVKSKKSNINMCKKICLIKFLFQKNKYTWLK